MNERQNIQKYLEDMNQSRVTGQTVANYNKLFAFIRREDKEKKVLLNKIK